jgi:8-oxo-dGTP pyrophosphatase MutT (NUDIX family)
MENPWKTKESKEIYDNPWIKLDHHSVINPANKEGIYGTVHFKNLAIGIIPLDGQLNCWIVGQYRYPLNQYSWEIPEGGGKLNVPPLDSAKRELREETGLEAKEWSEIQRIHTSNSVTDELGIIYLAQGLEEFDSQPDEDEQLTIKKLPFSQVLSMVLNGEITDSLSVAGILKVKVLLDKNQI